MKGMIRGKRGTTARVGFEQDEVVSCTVETVTPA